MITDAPPRKVNHRVGFLESDRIKTVGLPRDRRLLTIARSIEAEIKGGTIVNVRRACAEFLDAASAFYRVPRCSVRVPAARPLRVRENWSTELFEDYTPETMLVRVWMKTAVRKEITAFGTFLKHSLPRILPPSGFSEVRICRLVAYTGVLRASRSALPLCEGNAAKAPVLGGSKWRAMADRLAEDESNHTTRVRIVCNGKPKHRSATIHAGRFALLAMVGLTNL